MAMKLVELVFFCFFSSIVHCEESFILQLNEEVSVVKHVRTDKCFNKSLTGPANINGSEVSICIAIR